MSVDRAGILKRPEEILTWAIEISVYCLVFIIPFSKSAIEIFAVAAIMLWLVKQAASCKARITCYFPATPLAAPVFMYFAVCCVSAVFSTNVNLSIKGLFSKLAEYILIFFVCIDTFSRKEGSGRRLNMLLAAVTLSAVLLFSDAAFQWIYGKDFIRGYKIERLNACFSSANGLAGYIITVIPLLLCVAFTGFKKKQFMIKFGSVILYLAGMVLLGKTLSRGGWIGYLASSVFLVFIAGIMVSKRIKTTRWLVFLTILCTSILLVATGISIKPVKDRLMSIRTGITASTSRLTLWKEAISIIEDFPVLGTGPNTYTSLISRYSASKITGSYPHNSYLHMAAEVGIAGLISFLWILWRFFYNGLRSFERHMPHNREERNRQIVLLGIMTGVSATLVHSFFDTNFFALQFAVLFWAMLGLGAAYMKAGIEKT